MKRKLAFLLALVMLVCVCFTACGDDTKSKKEESEDRQDDEIVYPVDKTDKIEVPKLVGKMYYAEVENNTEYDHNFNFSIKWEEAKNPDIENGEVFKQTPAAGTKVEKGATITLYVNKATPTSSLDADAEIEGEHKEDVRRLLQDAGFTVKETISSDTNVPADCVISIDIEPGKSYPCGTAVTMVVSTGPSALAPIAIPYGLIGNSYSYANRVLFNSGYIGDTALLEEDYTEEAFAEAGTVMAVIVDGVRMEDFPSEMAPDTSLILVISTGEKAE